MRINLLKGRLGNHRFHPMLVHFPSALYPFSFVTDLVCRFTQNDSFGLAGLSALVGAVSVSIVAMIYGMIDFLLINSESEAWKKAMIHAMLNVTWFIIFAGLLFYRLKHPNLSHEIGYLTVMGIGVAGLFFSNYQGADLIIRHRIGIGEDINNAR